MRLFLRLDVLLSAPETPNTPNGAGSRETPRSRAETERVSPDHCGWRRLHREAAVTVVRQSQLIQKVTVTIVAHAHARQAPGTVLRAT